MRPEPWRICTNCWTVVAVEDEGTCDCPFRDEEPNHIDVVPMARLVNWPNGGDTLLVIRRRLGWTWRIAKSTKEADAAFADGDSVCEFTPKPEADQYRRERDELLARVDRLRRYLRSLPGDPLTALYETADKIKGER